MPRHTKSLFRSLLPAIIVLAGLLLLAAIIHFLTKDADIALLNPKGMVANEQFKLLVTSTLIMLAFAIPVSLTIYFFAWRYREDNQKTTFNPAMKENKGYLLFAWGGPMIVVAILASLMIPATHQLAHQKPIESDKKPLTVQVVALNWKWLFIYPEQGIASLNYTQIPVDTPVRFELTADGAPMSSFWVPHLGGMLYVMTGHVNPINLIGDTIGEYPGGSAEINGRGFANMRFMANVSSQNDFDTWVKEAKQSPTALSTEEYEKLQQPSENDKPQIFRDASPDFYSKIVSKYAGSHDHSSSNHEEYGSY